MRRPGASFCIVAGQLPKQQPALDELPVALKKCCPQRVRKLAASASLFSVVPVEEDVLQEHTTTVRKTNGEYENEREKHAAHRRVRSPAASGGPGTFSARDQRGGRSEPESAGQRPEPGQEEGPAEAGGPYTGCDQRGMSGAWLGCLRSCCVVLCRLSHLCAGCAGQRAASAEQRLSSRRQRQVTLA